MLEQNQIDKIKEAVEEFFGKMTVVVSSTEISVSSEKKDSQDEKDQPEDDRDIVNLEIKLDEPQILIGQQGQTLFETQRLLKNVLNRRLQKIFYLNLDINSYKKKKVEYLKDVAKEIADQVALSKEAKALQPMSAYERRIVHAELSGREDVVTESQGDGLDRHIVIKPK